MIRTHGYLHVESHSAFEAACAAYGCLIDLGDFAIERIQPALAQCYRRGRYDYSALEFIGEWRVPVTVRTDDAGTIPDEAWRMLNNVEAFLDFRVYPEKGQGVIPWAANPSQTPNDAIELGLERETPRTFPQYDKTSPAPTVALAEG